MLDAWFFRVASAVPSAAAISLLLDPLAMRGWTFSGGEWIGATFECFNALGKADARAYSDEFCCLLN